MRSLARAFRDRLAPALLTAAGVTLLAAGLLHYGGPARPARPARPVAVHRSPPSRRRRSSSPSLPPIDGSASAAPSPSPTRTGSRPAS